MHPGLKPWSSSEVLSRNTLVFLPHALSQLSCDLLLPGSQSHPQPGLPATSVDIPHHVTQQSAQWLKMQILSSHSTPYDGLQNLALTFWTSPRTCLLPQQCRSSLCSSTPVPCLGPFTPRTLSTEYSQWWAVMFCPSLYSWFLVELPATQCWKDEGNKNSQGCEKLVMVRLKPKVGRVCFNEGDMPDTLGVLRQVREGAAFLKISVLYDSNENRLKFSLQHRPICIEGFYCFMTN